jgi:arsenite oxidase small subunit
MERRGFVKLCASALAGITASPELLAEGMREVHVYERVKLVDANSHDPVTGSSLDEGETYLFHYPFVTTPCFLIDLGQPLTSRKTMRTKEGKSYSWPGGVGPNRSIVAFSAICAHRMSHPAPSVSFINYRHGRTKYRNQDDEIAEGSNVIYCCSEKSVYDPARGGQVLGGPAPQPLAAIALDYVEAEDQFYAMATIGGEMFERYFESFGDRLILDHERLDVRRESTDTADLMKLDDYSAKQILC